MQPDSRQTIHMGLGFIVSPGPTIDRIRSLKFQQSLIEGNVEFTKVEFNEQSLLVVREAPTRLEIRAEVVQPDLLGQLVIIAPALADDNELYSFELLAREAQTVIEAFENTWPSPGKRQIVGSEVSFSPRGHYGPISTIRASQCLY